MISRIPSGSATGRTQMTAICGSDEGCAAQSAAESNIPRVFKNGRKLDASGMEKLITLSTAELRQSKARSGIPR